MKLYQLRLDDADHYPDSLLHHVGQHHILVTSKRRLTVDYHYNAADLISEELALAYKQALIPVFKKRYGENSSLQVVSLITSESDYSNKALKDSREVEKWLNSND